MSTQQNVEVVKNFLAALGRRDKQGLLALSAEDMEWIIPGESWPLAGTHSKTSKPACPRRREIANKKQIRRIAHDRRVALRHFART
ncbi:MAG TPA: hypothetical protein VKR52_08140 [Terracidiphilus sp.]|nr:hypothetical protein [Terracidiphilus sp.]